MYKTQEKYIDRNQISKIKTAKAANQLQQHSEKTKITVAEDLVKNGKDRYMIFIYNFLYKYF